MPDSRAPSGRPAPLTDLVLALLRDLPGLLTDRIDLFSLELHRAGLVLRQTILLGVLVAIFAATAWLVLWSGLVALLVEAGLHWSLALGVAWLANVSAGVVAGRRVVRLLPLLKLPATRRHLTPRMNTPSRSEPHDLVPPAAGSPVAR